jgi:hypothetical protein
MTETQLKKATGGGSSGAAARRNERSFALFQIRVAQNFAMTSPPKVNCERFVPAAKGVVPFKDQS